MLDGSGNDTIDIADVTPIAANYGSEVAGYAIQFAETEDAQTWADVSQFPFSLASGDERSFFEVNAALSGGGYYCVTPFDAAGTRGVRGIPVHYDPAATYIASGYVLDDTGAGMQDVAISIRYGGGVAVTDASGHWESEGLGNGEYTAVPSKDGYRFQPSTRIFRISSADKTVENFTGSPLGFWILEIVDAAGDVGDGNSIAVDGENNIHISYSDVGNADLRYAVKKSGQWAIKALDSPGDTGWDTSIALDSRDYPWISYVDTNPGYLHIANYDGADWQFETVTYSLPAEATSLAIDSSDNPHAGIFNSEELKLYYVGYFGTSWRGELVGGVGTGGGFPSLAVNSEGYSSLSFYDANSGTLKYSAYDGAYWHSQLLQDSSGNPGPSSSLVLDSASLPCVAFTCRADNSVRYAHRPSSSLVVENVVAGGEEKEHLSLALGPDGYPCIAYSHAGGGNPNLHFAYFDGAFWHSEELPCNTTSAGVCDLALDSEGQPHISFYDEATGDLMHLYRTTVPPPANKSPVVHLEAVPPAGTIPLDILFDAGASYDLDGTIVDYEWDFDGDEIFDYSTGMNPTTSRNYPITGDYKCTVRVTDNGGSSATATITVFPDAPPEAFIAADVTEGEVPLVVNFDASASYDPDGTVEKYEWDWEGDGVFDYDSGSSPLASHKYREGGVYPSAVRITDDDGSTDVASVTITAIDHWDKHILDTGYSTGYWCSLAVIAGYPAISYSSDYCRELRYIRATDALGSSWGVPITVYSTAIFGNLGAHSSLNVINGYPAISCCDENGRLMFVRAGDAQGATWNNPVRPDIDSAGWHSSLCIVNGHPAISYYDIRSLNEDLKYVRALDPDGVTWDTPLILDSVGNTGVGTSLAVIDGNPAVSYYDESNCELMYIRALDANGSSWDNPQAVDAIGDVANLDRSTLVEVSGNPAICYADKKVNEVKYVRALDIEGNSWGTPMVVGSASLANDVSMQVIDGRPAIAFVDSDSRYVIYVRALDPDGAAWDAPAVVDCSLIPDGSHGLPTLCEVSGVPALAYTCGPFGPLDDLKYVLKYTYFIP